MLDKEDNVFLCNHCHGKMTTGEKCWTLWLLPPELSKTQYKAIKMLEYQNAPMICLTCAKELINFKLK